MRLASRPERLGYRPRNASSARTNRHASRKSRRRRLAGEPVSPRHSRREGVLGAAVAAYIQSRRSQRAAPDTETVRSNWRELPIERAGGASTSLAHLPISAPAPSASCSRCSRGLPAKNTKGFGTEFRKHALQTAEEKGPNAARVGLSERATFSPCDYASGLTGPLRSCRSNPPYIVRRISAEPGEDARCGITIPWRPLDGGADGTGRLRAEQPDPQGGSAAGTRRASLVDGSRARRKAAQLKLL